jgi:hypothetical protein
MDTFWLATGEGDNPNVNEYISFKMSVPHCSPEGRARRVDPDPTGSKISISSGPGLKISDMMSFR